MRPPTPTFLCPDVVIDPRIHYGDPYLIERLASDLDRLAERVTAGATSIAQSASAIGFEGPKAERFRDRVAEGRSRSGSVSGQMSMLANSLRLVAAMARSNIEAYERAVNHNPYDELQ